MLQSLSPGTLRNTRARFFPVSRERTPPERSRHLHSFLRCILILVQLWSSRRLLWTVTGVFCYGIFRICCPQRDRCVTCIFRSKQAIMAMLQHSIWSAMPRAQPAIKSYKSASSTTWRTDPKYAIPGADDATFRAGVFNTSPAWFQQGHHVRTAAGSSTVLLT